MIKNKLESSVTKTFSNNQSSKNIYKARLVITLFSLVFSASIEVIQAIGRVEVRVKDHQIQPSGVPRPPKPALRKITKEQIVRAEAKIKNDSNNIEISDLQTEYENSAENGKTTKDRVEARRALDVLNKNFIEVSPEIQSNFGEFSFEEANTVNPTVENLITKNDLNHDLTSEARKTIVEESKTGLSKGQTIREFFDSLRTKIVDAINVAKTKSMNLFGKETKAQRKTRKEDEFNAVDDIFSTSNMKQPVNWINNSRQSNIVI